VVSITPFLSPETMIRRITTRSGVRYIENGRFVNSQRGSREWVRQNFDTLQQSDRSQLTTRERRSFGAQNRYRYNGRYVSNPYNYWSRFEPTTRGNRNLDRFFSREDFEAISRFGIDRLVTRRGDGTLQRSNGELFDIANTFQNFIRDGYEFNLITDTGEPLSNLRAIDYLRTWEGRTIERIQREEGRPLDRIRINYPHTINTETRTIELNLNDIDDDTDIEAYFDTP
jgi:hypothetical protein